MVSMATAGGQENLKIIFLHVKFNSKLLAKNWGNLFDFTESYPEGAVSP